MMRFILAQTPSTDGAIDLIQLGFVGVAILWFALGKVHPDSTVKDLREQLAIERKRADTETADAKAVRDAVIKDVIPVMALMGERSRETAELGERLLAIVLKKEG
jgi:hypothetical protein